jgi:Ca2+-binding RTX toxin-like protein
MLVGTDGVDEIHAAAGNDVVQGLGGDDKLYGEDGSDKILGGDGNDTIDGGAGDDVLVGEAGNDHILGGAGTDVIDGGAGNNILEGGDGSDIYSDRAGDGSHTIIETAGQSGDQDQLFFDDANFADVTIAHSGKDITLTVDGQTVTLKDQLLGNGNGVEAVTFADGKVLAGSEIAAAAVNHGPAADATLAVGGDEDTVIQGQVLATDADGDTLTYAVKTGFDTQNGAVTLDAATGAFSYHPTGDYHGADAFTVVVSDGYGGTVEQLVNIDVHPVNDAPLAVDDVGSAHESEVKVFDLVANDTDVDGDGLSLASFDVSSVDGIDLTVEQAKAAFSIDGDGKLAFTPGDIFKTLEDGKAATVALSYTVSDGHGGADTGTFTLTIDGEGHNLQVINGTAGSDVLVATDAGAAFEAGAGNDYVFGGAAGDVVNAGEGNDYTFGNGGDDVMNGGAGHDTMFGGDGNDTLIGGAGNDRLTGGAGADSFVFHSGFGHDTVLDFDSDDVIDVSTSDFADFAALSSHLADTALGVTLTLEDGSTLTVANMTKANLHADDFHFAA